MVAFAVMMMRGFGVALLALWIAPATLAQAPVTAFVGGAWADLAVYTASPLADIRNTKTLESVWISGAKLH